MKQPIFQASRKDFRVEYFRGSGPGGQHRNKKDTACRITHIETGLVAESQRHKSQDRNKKEAFRKLAEKLLERVKESETPERQKIAQVIRTYHYPRAIAKDHRTGVTLPLKKVLDGDIDDFIEAMLLEADEHLGKQ